jgi:hypothetical protein
MTERFIRERHSNNYKTDIKVWEYLYRVRVPYLQYRSIDDIKKFGVGLSGISEIDNDKTNEIIAVMIPISKMVECFSNGVSVLIPNSTDIKDIYDAISDHINAWKKMLQNGINIGDAPIDDLIDMDKFANSVYSYAKYEFTPDILNSIIANQLASVQKINVTNFFNQSPTVNNDSEYGVTRINAEPTPDRDSYSEFFKSRLIYTRRK